MTILKLLRMLDTKEQVAQLMEARINEQNAEIEKLRGLLGVKEACAIEMQRKIAEQNAELEKLRMQLAACGVAAMCNTRESVAKQRIDADNPYWCASYSDVCQAVDREMQLRDRLNASRLLVRYWHKRAIDEGRTAADLKKLLEWLQTEGIEP